MDPFSKLRQQIEDYSEALRDHSGKIGDEFDELKCHADQLLEVFAGNAAERFSEAWKGTMEMFGTYTDSTGRIAVILRQQAEKLAQADQEGFRGV